MPFSPPQHEAHGRRSPKVAAAERPTSAQRGYDATWRKLRLMHLARHPLCAACERAGRITEAVDVHHIEPIALRPDRRLDPSNLESLCTSCHSRETRREMGGMVHSPAGA